MADHGAVVGDRLATLGVWEVKNGTLQLGLYRKECQSVGYELSKEAIWGDRQLTQLAPTSSGLRACLSYWGVASDETAVLGAGGTDRAPARALARSPCG